MNKDLFLSSCKNLQFSVSLYLVGRNTESEVLKSYFFLRELIPSVPKNDLMSTTCRDEFAKTLSFLEQFEEQIKLEKQTKIYVIMGELRKYCTEAENFLNGNPFDLTLSFVQEIIENIKFLGLEYYPYTDDEKEELMTLLEKAKVYNEKLALSYKDFK